MKFSKLVRRSHMYLALFLTPWLVVYAMSGFVLNHGAWFMPGHGTDRQAPPFVKLEERPYEAVFSPEADRQMIGMAVLEELGLPGAFGIQGGGQKLVFMRNSAGAVHRVTYLRATQRLIVEKQTLTVPMFLNRTHFRHGYEQPYAAAIAWAVIVDLVILALIFWVLSGLWMWWEIKPARAWGGVFGLLGVAVFFLLAFRI
jgi:hypothetical protein